METRENQSGFSGLLFNVDPGDYWGEYRCAHTHTHSSQLVYLSTTPARGSSLVSKEDSGGSSAARYSDHRILGHVHFVTGTKGHLTTRSMTVLSDRRCSVDYTKSHRNANLCLIRRIHAFNNWDINFGSANTDESKRVVKVAIELSSLSIYFSV